MGKRGRSAQSHHRQNGSHVTSEQGASSTPEGDIVVSGFDAGLGDESTGGEVAQETGGRTPPPGAEPEPPRDGEPDTAIC